MLRIDLNSDAGEGFGAWKLGCDEDAMPFITSANVACGFHASDPLTMIRTVRLAKAHGVAVGAHPGFHDLVGFGRRAMAASLEEIRADVIYQVGALWGVCRSEGVRMQHVKPHGALYNLAAEDVSVATAIADAIKSVDPELVMVCLANSKMVDGAMNAGLRFVEEAFADRAYTADGTLVSRRVAGAVLEDIDMIAERVWSMIHDGSIASLDGAIVPINAQTICVHGDTPGAVEMIRAIRSRIKAGGVELKAFGK
ncbi:LamB/YcsF family protein [bacterium]|nr:LamB/YcsF family protein [bacterium]